MPESATYVPAPSVTHVPAPMHKGALGSLQWRTTQEALLLLAAVVKYFAPFGADQSVRE